MPIKIIRAPRLGLAYSEAASHGFWHRLHIGPFSIYWGKIKSPADICARRGHNLVPRRSGRDFDGPRSPMQCDRCGHDPIIDNMIDALRAKEGERKMP